MLIQSCPLNAFGETTPELSSQSQNKIQPQNVLVFGGPQHAPASITYKPQWFYFSQFLYKMSLIYNNSAYFSLAGCEYICQFWVIFFYDQQIIRGIRAILIKICNEKLKFSLSVIVLSRTSFGLQFMEQSGLRKLSHIGIGGKIRYNLIARVEIIVL